MALVADTALSHHSLTHSLPNIEAALRGLGFKSISAEGFQHEPHMFVMVHGGATKNNYVVQIDHAETANVRGQHSVHQSLKHTGRIGQAERHPAKLKQPSVADERRLLHAVFVDLDLPVTAFEV